MECFDEIRPYHDHEVRPTLDRLLKDRQLLQALAQHQYPTMTNLMGPLMPLLTRLGLKLKLRGIDDVNGFQKAIEPFLTRVIQASTENVSFSGLESLSKDQAYLYLSNHRDIVMDPAFVNYGLYFNEMTTVRIAIGDNLVQRPFVNDLMRLNKSFIVKRSVEGRREKLRSYQTLSAYIHHSIDTGHPVWIAQSEGRAKDGNDQTDTAIIKMFHMSRKAKDASFADSIRAMNIVPVSISYEYDPCDQAKARELYETSKHGAYEKEEGEDLQSIVKGIEGHKGRVHIAFGTPLTGEYQNATQVVEEVNRQVHQLYRLFPSNLLAFESLRSEHPEIQAPPLESLFAELCPDEDLAARQKEFQERVDACPSELRPWLLAMYANPVINRYRKILKAAA